MYTKQSKKYSNYKNNNNTQISPSLCDVKVEMDD